MRYSVIFALVIGTSMIGQWLFSFFTKQIPELKDEPVRIGFHITAEIITATVLIVSGVALYFDLGWGTEVSLIAIGMLFYTSIVSPGYFAQKNDWKWVGIFSFIIIGGIVSVARLIQ